MSRSFKWLLAITLLLLTALAATANGAGGSTKDYTWLLLLKVNEPPVVDAGVDQEITWAADSVYLDATVTDDPRDSLTYSWSKLEGPGDASFFPSDTEDTTVTFSTSGTYILQLSASDSKLSSTSTVAIILNNSAPSVNAGADKNFDYPTLSAFLNATVSDDPMDTLSYAWSKVDGPGSVTFSNPSAEDTNASFSLSGAYTLKLHVSDGELASTDSLIVDFLPNPANKIDVIVAFGDSITVGFGDSDCIEGYAKACSGYTVRLKGMLAGANNYASSVTIWEEGKGGETALGGLSRINGIISAHPGADQYLVQYGTNDALSDPPPSKAVFKSRMGAIVQAIYFSPGNPQPALAKAPWAKGTRSYANSAIQLYNSAVTELYYEKSYIKVSPPDFYVHFESHPEQIWSYFMFDIDLPIEERRVDDLHPRDTGYDAMANIWRYKLTQ